MYGEHQQRRRVQRHPGRDGRSTLDHLRHLGFNALAHVQLHATLASMTLARAQQLIHSRKRFKSCRRRTLLHCQDINLRPPLENATQPRRLVRVRKPLHRIFRYIVSSDIPSHHVRGLHANHLLRNLLQRTRTQIAGSPQCSTFGRRRCQALQQASEKGIRISRPPFPFTRIPNRSTHSIANTTAVSFVP